MGHKIEKKHRSGDHRRSHDGHRRRPRSHSHEMALVVREASGAGEQPPDDGARLFVVDKRGDPLILKYGTNDRSRVPEYRRLRSWKVLGSREPISISREGAKKSSPVETTGTAAPCSGRSTICYRKLLAPRAELCGKSPRLEMAVLPWTRESSCSSARPVRDGARAARARLAVTRGALV